MRLDKMVWKVQLMKTRSCFLNGFIRLIVEIKVLSVYLSSLIR